MKSNKAVAARFKVTGTGKLVRRHPGRRHILTKKVSETQTPSQKRRFGRQRTSKNVFPHDVSGLD